MKKNKMMRLASAMMVMTLMTTSVISGTFAKYVTTESSTDSARVAKWGVKITANGSTFADAYEKGDAAFVETYSVYSAVDTTIDNGTIANKDNVLAPGTSGKMVSVSLEGTPEVAVRVTCSDANLDLGLDGGNWKYSDDTYYCPLVINVTRREGDAIDNASNTEKFYGMTYSSASEFETAVESFIKGYRKDYPVNTNLSTEGANALVISWEWAFEKDEDPLTLLDNGNSDVKDTYLGDRAAQNVVDFAPTVSLTVETTVTQID